jgi:hypothetical protein
LEIGPILYGDELIFYSNDRTNGVERPLFFLDTINGSVKRTWSNATGIDFRKEDAAQTGNYLVFGDLSSVTCWDLQSNALTWSNNQLAGTGIYEHNGYVYRGTYFKSSGTSNNAAAMLRSPVETNQWDTVYSLKPTENYSFRFFGCGFSNLPNGDEIVVWKSRSWTGWDTVYAQIFAYNLTADTLLWSSDVFFDEETTKGTLKVVDGVVYGLLERSVVAINLYSGKTIWAKKLWYDTNFNYRVDHFYIQDGYVLISYAYNDYTTLVYLNKSDGQISRMAQGLPQISQPYVYFEGKLFGTGDRISCVDIASGKDLLANSIQNNVAEHFWPTSRITIDPIRRVFYCHDGVYAYCIKIPDL